MTLGSEIVVTLKVMPPAMIASAKMPISTIGRDTGMTPALPFRWAMPSPSPGTSARKAAPTARQTRPGTTKAACQPSVAATMAVTPDADAAPRLPHTPFQPRSRPSRRAWVTSIAPPIGW